MGLLERRKLGPIPGLFCDRCHGRLAIQSVYLCAVRILSISVLVWIQAYLVAPDLVRLPLLLMHFQEHQQELPDLTFSAFLVLHYDDTEHEQQDQEDHEDLPFHHHHGTAADQCALKVFENGPASSVYLPMASAGTAIPTEGDADLRTGHGAELLRPPRDQA